MCDLVVGVRDQHLHGVAVRQAHDDLRGRTEVHETIDHPGQVVLPGASVLDDAGALGADDDLRGAGRAHRAAPGPQLEPLQAHAVTAPGSRAERLDREQVGHAEKVGDVRVRRLGVHLAGRTDLRDDAVVHHGEAVAHRERLFLVVRHVDEGDADVALQCGELVLERLAQLRVEGTERFVEQQHRRFEHQRAGKRDPLLLPTGELRGLALRQPLEAHERDRVADPALPVGLAHAALPPQAVRDVVLDVEVREQRVALEHRVHGPAVRGRAREVDAVEQDRPGRRLLEPGDETQRRGLAATRRAEEREELPRADREVDAVDGDEIAEPLLEADQLDRAAGRARRAAAARLSATGRRVGLRGHCPRGHAAL